jgi:hypothetical protein
VTEFRVKNRAVREYAGMLLGLSPDMADNFLRKTLREDETSENFDLIILRDIVCLTRMLAFLPSNLWE